jgi:pimeloyl-ACP methyl ester carboxylesterase
MSATFGIEFLEAPDRHRLAYAYSPGGQPGVVFLGGFMSDMEGSKALALEAFCRARGRAYLRLDYSGHGHSGGRFEDGTISSWRDDALAIIDAVTEGSIVVIGSSLGGWLALLVALSRPERVVGLIGLAAAPDFTEELMWDRFDAAQKRQIMSQGVVKLASNYDEPYPITRALVEDGRRNLLLDGPIDIRVPVRLIQGGDDPEVPAEMPGRIADHLTSNDVRVLIIDGGDHSLARQEDIATIQSVLETLLEGLSSGGPELAPAKP